MTIATKSITKNEKEFTIEHEDTKLVYSLIDRVVQLVNGDEVIDLLDLPDYSHSFFPQRVKKIWTAVTMQWKNAPSFFRSVGVNGSEAFYLRVIANLNNGGGNSVEERIYNTLVCTIRFPMYEKMYAMGLDWRDLGSKKDSRICIQKRSSSVHGALGWPRWYLKHFLTNPPIVQSQISAGALALKAQQKYGREMAEDLLRFGPRMAWAYHYLYGSFARVNRNPNGERFMKCNWRKVHDYLVPFKDAQICRLYTDYLYMCFEMGIEGHRFPDDLRSAHDHVQKLYQSKNNSHLIQQFQHMLHKPAVRALEGRFGGYQFILPEEPADLTNEGIALRHCVNSYAKDVADGRCFILFMRTTSNLDDPLITIEIRDGQILQAKGFANRRPTSEEVAIIRMWALEKGLKVTSY